MEVKDEGWKRAGAKSWQVAEVVQGGKGEVKGLKKIKIGENMTGGMSGVKE